MGLRPKSNIALLLIFMLGAFQAQAREADHEESEPVPCALVEHYTGDLQLLNSTREHLLKVGTRASIPCGGWISVGKGGAQLRHREGFLIHLGAGTFVQLLESNVDGRFSGDQVVLFRGQLYAQAKGGSGEFRVITANARSRVQRGSAMIVFNHDDEETQLIALDNVSSIENRFENSRAVKVKPGEASSLNFKLLRVVPANPRAVAVAALRPKFDDLNVPERERTFALRSVRARQERLFASELVPIEGKLAGDRKIASVEEGDHAATPSAHASKPAKTYIRHDFGSEGDELHQKLVNRTVAGEKAGEKILFPDKFYGRERKASVEVLDLDARYKKNKPGAEDLEKRKLIEELSRIHED